MRSARVRGAQARARGAQAAVRVRCAQAARYFRRHLNHTPLFVLIPRTMLFAFFFAALFAVCRRYY